MQSSSKPMNSPTPPASAPDDAINVLIRIRPADGDISASSSSTSTSLPPATPRMTAHRDNNAFEVEGNTIAEPKAGLTFNFDLVYRQNAEQVMYRDQGQL